MKKIFAMACLLGILAGAFALTNLQTWNVQAQSSLWESYCPGDVTMVQQGSGTLVTCTERRPTTVPPTSTPLPPQPTATGPAGNRGIVVDQNSVALFERIPAEYLTAARNLKVLFSDRSVGNNFHLGLDCLEAQSFGLAPAYCRRHYDGGTVRTFSQADLTAGRVPPVISFAPNPTTYNRDRWVFAERGGHWSELTCDFVQSLAPANLDKDVLSYQFSYLNIENGSDIMEFFENRSDHCDIYDLEAFIAQHPDKTFVFWTASLARSIGTQAATDFNNRLRQYARDNNKILFDFAAIESTTQSGQPCYDNRDGVLFTSPSNGNAENYPNDGTNHPAICQDYTTEIDGGHLGSVSGGMIRTAKAFWVLMAQVAGWRP